MIFIGMPKNKISKAEVDTIYDELIIKQTILNQADLNTNQFVTSDYCIAGIHTPTSIWASGSKTWKKIVAFKFWVNGSADNFGHEYLKKFKDSKLVLQRIANHKKQYGTKPVDDEYKNLVQVFFVMNNSDSYFKLRKNRGLFKDNKTEFYTEYIDDPKDDENVLDLYYLVVDFDSKNYEKHIVEYSKALANTLAIDDNDNFIESKVLKKENFILFTDDSEFIKIKAIN